MKITKGIVYRIYPTTEQEETLAIVFGQARWTFNHYLQVRSEYYRRTKKGIGYSQTAGMLARLKATKGLSWLQEASSQVLQQSLRDLDKAFQRFFKGKSEYPNFKSKRGRQSVRYPNQAVDVISTAPRKGFVRLAKVGEVRMVIHKPLQGRVLNVTISKTKSGRYYASICVECEITPPQNKSEREIGIDVGLSSFIVSSEGEKVAPPKYLAKAEKKLNRLNRQLSRRKKGSNNREEGRLQLARLHEKIAAQRINFTHQLSTNLTRSHSAIAIENLNIKGMLANHCLAKSIADAAWSAFFSQLAYKGVWYNCDIRKIGRFLPSSKTCSSCGIVIPELPLVVRDWTCPACGTHHDRDVNAAINILCFSRGRRFPKVTPAESYLSQNTRQLVETGIEFRVVT